MKSTKNWESTEVSSDQHFRRGGYNRRILEKNQFHRKDGPDYLSLVESHLFQVEQVWSRCSHVSSQLWFVNSSLRSCPKSLLSSDSLTSATGSPRVSGLGLVLPWRSGRKLSSCPRGVSRCGFWESRSRPTGLRRRSPVFRTVQGTPGRSGLVTFGVREGGWCPRSRTLRPEAWLWHRHARSRALGKARGSGRRAGHPGA